MIRGLYTVRYSAGLNSGVSGHHDFNDGDYDGWSVLSGTWSAASNYLEATSGTWASITKPYDHDDGTVWFRYYLDDDSSGSMVAYVSFRYLDGNNRAAIRIYPFGMTLQDQNGGVWTTYDSDWSYKTVAEADTWYDVCVHFEGPHASVWRRESGGGSMTKVLETDGLTITTSDAFSFNPVTSDDGMRFDNVEIGYDDFDTHTVYAYDDANELTTMTVDPGEDYASTTVFAYDAWGRTVTKTMDDMYEANFYYLYGDKLKSAVSDFPSESAVVNYNYDGLGKQRCKALSATDWTWYRWAGWRMVNQYHDTDEDWDINDGTLELTYAAGLAEITGSDPASGTYRYYSTDHLGSIRSVRAEDKSSLASFEYKPYGALHASSGSLDLNIGFTGHRWDPDVQQYFAPYRYYSPATARWLTRDPLGMVDGANVYAYGGGDPISTSDPMGLFRIIDSPNCRTYARKIRNISKSILRGFGNMFYNYSKWPPGHPEREKHWEKLFQEQIPNLLKQSKRFLAECIKDDDDDDNPECPVIPIAYEWEVQWHFSWDRAERLLERFVWQLPEFPVPWFEDRPDPGDIMDF